MEFDINKRITEALKDIDVQIIEGWYDENLNEDHITFFIYTEVPKTVLDDELETLKYSFQIDIWSKDSTKAYELKSKVRKLLLQNGFTFTEGNDKYETDTGIYHKAMRFDTEDIF